MTTTRLLLLFAAFLASGTGAGLLHAQEQATNENTQEYVYRGYYVGDLMGETFPPKGFSEDDMSKMEAVADMIRSSCDPETWSEETSIIQLINSGTLFIHQTESVHVQIKEWLANLRKANNISESHRLASGDVLQIYIQTVTTGIPDHPVPVYQPPKDVRFLERTVDDFHIEQIDQLFQDGAIPPEKGNVFTVRSDGTIALPKMMHALNIEGMTLDETQSLLRHAYINVLQILSSEAVITVSLIPSGSDVEQTQSFPQLNELFFFDPKAKYSLQTVLDRIHEKSSLAVVISDEVLKKMGDPQHVTVHARMPFAMPLKDYLNYLVRQKDLAWHFKDGTINITTTDASTNPDNELFFRAYYIADLTRFAGPTSDMSEIGDFEAIADYIQTMVTSGIWNEERSLMIAYGWDTMFVNQTKSVHEQIVNLLIFMRKCRIGMSR